MTTLPRSLVSLDDVSPECLVEILDRAAYFEATDYRGLELSRRNVCLCFFQPSTRTRVGFAAATGRLGGTPITVECVKHQPGMAGPESVEDTIRAVARYSDLMVMRHENVDQLKKAARLAAVPFVNGGSGYWFHPTQTMIDLYTMRRHLGRMTGLRIGIVGDIATSRTAHSLLHALAWFAPTEVRLMHPPARGPQRDVSERLPAEVVTTRTELDPAGLDVLYVAGLPPGEGCSRLSDAVRTPFVLTTERMQRLPGHGVVLCALPRTGDIHPSVDADPRAVYFEQSGWGLFVRMAILESMIQT